MQGLIRFASWASRILNWVAGLPLPPWAIMGVIVFIYLIGGCFMDFLAMIMLTIPSSTLSLWASVMTPSGLGWSSF
jgi:TRAP-type C4-dicarboxylate transport system permease large subunit